MLGNLKWYSNIRSCISLIDTLTHWVFVPCLGPCNHSSILTSNPYVSLIDCLTYCIFSHVSVIPIVPAFQDSILYQPDLHAHTLSIRSMPRPSLSFLYSNIQSYVSLIDCLTYCIFSHVSVIPIIPVFQYLILYQPDLHAHTLSIFSVPRPFRLC
jgi:hypothetical protein